MNTFIENAFSKGDKLSQERGDLFLLGLFSREDNLRGYDIIISANWIGKYKKQILDYFSDELLKGLDIRDISLIEKLIILEPSDIFIKELIKSNINSKFTELFLFKPITENNIIINNILIKEAYYKINYFGDSTHPISKVIDSINEVYNSLFVIKNDPNRISDNYFLELLSSSKQSLKKLKSNFAVLIKEVLIGDNLKTILDSFINKVENIFRKYDTAKLFYSDPKKYPQGSILPSELYREISIQINDIYSDRVTILDFLKNIKMYTISERDLITQSLNMLKQLSDLQTVKSDLKYKLNVDNYYSFLSTIVSSLKSSIDNQRNIVPGGISHVEYYNKIFLLNNEVNIFLNKM